ncbi:type VI secretion system tube protein TssD, partial [uncultured Empedobacter sp.]
INLKWENGYVIQHELNFDALNDNNMLISFVVSAEKIDYGTASYDGVWPSAR